MANPAAGQPNFGMESSRTALAASFLINLVSLSQPVAFLHVYDRIIPNSGYETLAVLALGLIVAGGLELLLRQARAGLLHARAARIEARLCSAYLGRLFGGDLSAVEQDRPGAHLDRLNAIRNVAEYRAHTAVIARHDLAFVPVFLIALGFLSPAMAAVALFIAVMILVFPHGSERNGLAVTDARAASQAQRESFVIDSLRAIDGIKGKGLEDFLVRRYERLSGRFAAAGAEVTRGAEIAGGLNAVATQIAVILVAATGAALVIGGQASVGALAAALLLTGRIVQPVSQYRSLRSRQLDMIGWERRIAAFLSSMDLPVDARPVEPIRTIEVSALAFRPEGSPAPVLEDVSFSLRRGECIAIDGPSGSGKTALLWLMLGAFRHSAGDIRINGESIDRLDRDALGQRVVLIDRANVLFEGRVIDNITRFSLRENLPEALQLIAALGLNSFFSAHPQGLAMRVHPGHAALPNAVIDRIAIARALVGKPDVILIDETDLLLDPDSERRLAQLLVSRRREVAIVLVTRSPRFLALADRFYWLENGRMQAVPRSSLGSGRFSGHVA